MVLTLNVFVVLITVATASALLYGRGKDKIQRYAIPGLAGESTLGGGDDPSVTFPDGSSVDAQNWLITGSDNRSCIDPKSPYAGAFLASDVGGERSDTIMVMRVDPKHNFSAILSFPRDLYVKIGGTSRQAKINSAYDGTDPTRLIATIYRDFGVPIHHWLNVDFCAFKQLVDAVGGVGISFAYPTRDLNTGLNIPVSGCAHMMGDEALAYVRSRHYQYSTGKKTKSGRTQWISDPTGDFGRIRRQQQFVKVVAQKALDAGIRNPKTFNQILNSVVNNIKLDDTLDNGDLLKLGSKLVHLDPNATKTYMFQGDLGLAGGESIVRIPTSGPSKTFNDAVIRIFQGKARPADVSEVDSPTSLPDATLGSTTPTTAPGETTTTVSNDDLDVITVKEPAAFGIIPPVDPSCK